MAPLPSPCPRHPLPKTSPGGTDPYARDTRSPNTLITCANDTLGQSNAAQGSAGPASPGTAAGLAAGGLILHLDQGSARIRVCCTSESQLFFFGISCNFPFLLGEISRNTFLPSPSVGWFFFRPFALAENFTLDFSSSSAAQIPSIQYSIHPALIFQMNYSHPRAALA